MAEKKPTASYESIMKALRNREYAPVYILMGEESYYIDKISDYIADTLLQPEERDFNQTILFGADVTGVQVVDMAKGFPMMAERRVIIVKEAQALKGTEALEKYFEKPVPTTILVICHKNGTIDRRKKLVSKAEAVGVVFESKKMRDYELPGFVESYLSTKGATIDRKAATMVADHIGADLNRLTSELDKVLIALPEGEKRITPDIVERQIGVSKDFNAFELRNAIIEKNVFKANQIVNYFDKNPKSGSLPSCALQLLPKSDDCLLCATEKQRAGTCSIYGVERQLGCPGVYDRTAQLFRSEDTTDYIKTTRGGCSE